MLNRLLQALGFQSSASAPSSHAVRPEAGQLVSVTTEDGIGVMKVLAVDAIGVHVRLYVQRFPRRPSPTDIDELTTAAFGKEYSNPFSIGHVPLTFASFAKYSPQPLGRRELVDEELEGFRIWQEAQGGYF